MNSRNGLFLQPTRWLSFSLLWTALVASGLAQTTNAPAPTSTDDKLASVSQADRTAVRVVGQLIQRDHLLSQPIDDKMAERALGTFLKNLDPMKVYFLKSDVEEFQKLQTQIDDEIKKGVFTIALDIFKRFVQRVDESVAISQKWLEATHDFTADEEMVTDRDAYDYAASPEELDDRWRKRIKYNLLVEEGAENAKDDPVTRLKRRYSMYAKRMHQMDSEDVVEMFTTAVTSSFDPHTSYMSKRTYENFLIQMRLALEGIGATLSANDDGYTVIKRIVPNGAAAKQGQLSVEDRIVMVGQAPGTEMIDVVGMKLDDVVAKIRGKAGTIVRLAVLKEGADEIKTIEIVREKITLEDEAAHGQIFEEGKKADGSPFTVGVIRLPSFYADMESNSENRRSTTSDVKKILDDFNAKKVDALVLDLSQNGGGSLREAIDCTGLFIDAGPVVQVKDPDGRVEKLNDLQTGMSWSKPLVVLTSKFSASASEILAGAVQDYKRGLIVGDSTTHGKGTVQSLIDLNELIYRSDNPPKFHGALKITMQQFYRPDGDSTQKRGVLADVVLPSITDKMDVAESDLDYAVEFDRIPPASHVVMNQLTPEMVESLNAKAQQRIAESDFFKREAGRIEKYVQFKNEKTTSLNKEKYQARRKEFDKEKEDEKLIDQQVNSSSKTIEKTPYLEEVIKIAADYAKALGAG